VLYSSDMRHLTAHFGEQLLHNNATVVPVERLADAATVEAELGGDQTVVWLSWEYSEQALQGSGRLAQATHLPAPPLWVDERSSRDFAHACPLFAATRA
jgi:hypothetical protein